MTLTLIFVYVTQDEHTTENQLTSLESTPKKLLFWENNRSSSSAGGNKSDELMTIRLREMEAVTELRELRLRVMELETQVIETKLLLTTVGRFIRGRE